MRESKYAKNKTLLAARIAISRPALSRLFERGDYPPQVPGKGWDVAQWQRYSDHNIATWNRRSPRSSNGSNGTHGNPRDEALLNRTLIQAESERFKLDIARGKYELKTTTRELIAKYVSAFMRELDKAIKHELPPKCDGASAVEQRKVYGGRLDELRDRLVKQFRET